MLGTHLPVYLRSGAHNGREVGGDTGAGEALVDHAQAIVIFLRCLLRDGEVEPLRAVQLHVDQPWRENAAAEVDDFIGRQVQAVEDLLVAEDLAGARVDPEILLDQVPALDEAAVGELGDARGIHGLAGHREMMM